MKLRRTTKKIILTNDGIKEHGFDSDTFFIHRHMCVNTKMNVLCLRVMFKILLTSFCSFSEDLGFLRSGPGHSSADRCRRCDAHRQSLVIKFDIDNIPEIMMEFLRILLYFNKYVAFK